MKRTRLSPEARKEQLLDAAKASLLDAGMQQFSMKKLAVEAGVSENLLFHYFSCRVDLLQQLLHRDFNLTIDTLNAALDEASDLREILEIYVTRNYDQRAEENVIEILLSDPEIASVVEKRRTRNSAERERILIDTISKTLGIKRRKAAMFALMASAASMAAARFAHEKNISREESIETVIGFLTPAFESQIDQ